MMSPLIFLLGIGCGCSFFSTLASLESLISNQGDNSILKMRNLAIIVLLMALCVPVKLWASVETVFSPSRNIAVNFEVRDGVPFYNVVFNGKEVIKDSRLGLELVSVKGNGEFNNFDNKQFQDQNSLMDGFSMMTAKSVSFSLWRLI